MKKNAIGHVQCPVCPFEHAEVKEDKNGHAYIHCTDCNAQVFTRNEHRNTNLRKKMTPVTVTVTEPAPVAVTAPAPAPVAVAAPAPVAAPKKKSASWFTPILAGGDHA